MDKIKEILEQVMESKEFESSEDFIADGLLDSLQVMEMVEAIEEAFDIEISGRDIVPENFVSVEKIAELICKYDGEVD